MVPTDPPGDSGAPGPASPPAALSPKPLVTRVFMGPRGLRAGWRVLFFYILAFILIALCGAIPGFLGQTHILNADAARLLGNLAAVAGALAATFIMIQTDRARDPAVTISRAGLGSAGAARNIAAGALCGFLALSLLMGGLRIAGLYSIQSPPWSATMLTWAAYWAASFACTGMLEESLMRGYSLSALSEGIGFWPAAFLLAILFGAGHIANGGEEWLGIVNAVLVGVVFAYSVRFTGSLWWAIGAHATWDWAETYFWGVSDSGYVSEHHLFAGQPHGAALLSGGSVGPEGSLLCIPAILLILLFVRWTGYRAPAPLIAAAPPDRSVIGDRPLGQLPEDR